MALSDTECSPDRVAGVADLVEGATDAADRAVALLRAGAEPFDETAEGWIQSAFGLE